MSSPPPPPPQGEGLGRSNPIVTIAGAPPNFQQSLTPAAGNHPLAQPASTPPPPPPPPTGIQTQSAEAAQSQSVELTLSSDPSQFSMPPPPAEPPTSGAGGYHATAASSRTQPNVYASPPPGALAPHPNQFTSPPSPVATTPIKGTTSSSSNMASPVQSLDDLVDTFLSGPSYRTQQMLPPLLRPPPLVNEDPLQCLRTLVERRAWGDVLQVTADLLRGAESIYAPIYNSMLLQINSNIETPNDISAQLKEETAEIVALQCHAWLKLRRYTDLGQEIERWNFLPFNDNYNESQAPTWVPWSLHIIAAETMMHTTDDPYRGTDELYAIVSRIPESDDVRWKLCAYRALANAFSRKRDWRMAMVALERMLPFLGEATRQELANNNNNNTTNSRSTTISSPQLPSAQALLEAAYKAEVLSVQGRYLLHAGAVSEASHLFQVARNDWVQAKSEAGSTTLTVLEESNVVVQHIPAQLLANEGLVSFACANYDHAIECFKNATDTLRGFSLQPVYQAADWVGPAAVGVAPHTGLFNECINNMAICALYTCRMPEAVNLMESLVREDPTAFLTERVAFNLCTMYELGCDSTASARKKRVLQLVAKRFFLHDVGPESFRIN